MHERNGAGADAEKKADTVTPGHSGADPDATRPATSPDLSAMDINFACSLNDTMSRAAGGGRFLQKSGDIRQAAEKRRANRNGSSPAHRAPTGRRDRPVEKNLDGGWTPCGILRLGSPMDEASHRISPLDMSRHKPVFGGWEENIEAEADHAAPDKHPAGKGEPIFSNFTLTTAV